MRRLWFVVPVLGLTLVTAAAHGQGVNLRAPADFAGHADPDARSKAIFLEIGKVLRHPRCVNCHPKGDRPLQGEQGSVHEPPVQRGAVTGDDKGRGVTTMRCTTCHGSENFDPGRVPGGKNWHLADRSMAWEGESVATICRQILDRAENGGQDKDAVVHHLMTEALVEWAWTPGQGREKAPGTFKDFKSLVKAWDDSGAKCPD